MARPRGFEESAVLDAVTRAFWAGGYEGTSTRDIVGRTGLTQSSLYNAFGDKRAMFRQALDHYLANTLRERIARLERNPSPERAVAAFFWELLERSFADPLHRGCLLVNSVLEIQREDAELAALVAAELDYIRAFFERCLVRCTGIRVRENDGPQAANAKSVDPRDGAAQLLSLLVGISVLIRVTPDRAVLTRAIQSALRGLGLPDRLDTPDKPDTAANERAISARLHA
jgi:TetR/AcrR family transcriptional repressor of nem operon